MISRNTDGASIIVEPIPKPTGERWTPIAGQETLDFLSAVVPEESRHSICQVAASILAKGAKPTGEAEQTTGLVVGYVQSGKTMSFETVAALARDNSFQVVVVIAGIANHLLDQSTGRLRRDLQLDESSRARRWIQFRNPSADDTTLQAIRNALDDWGDPDTPEEFKKTVLITVLKHHGRLRDLVELMRALNTVKVPVLIVDDEADQASLNTEVTRGQESTTYRRLMALRQALPTHTYLQYTATPQAPLLVSIIDSLSPSFVQVLDPGPAYVGGLEFFTGNDAHVRVIPPRDVPTNINTLSEPPESLLNALRIFMLGVTAGINEGHNTGNRSMLVHPSHRTAQHQEYYNWVRNILENWKSILTIPDTDPDKQELMEDFRSAYDDLAQTVTSDFPAFDELAPLLRWAFRHTRVLEVNAREGRTPPVDWRSTYGWILVGGQAMDRGFTIEGLTVTYMPRGIGVGNADTIQQRARFFGYKRPYLGFCRVYLEEGTLHAFKKYVEHEEDIRAQLKQFQAAGRPLDDWKRAFVLDRGLRPCRQYVLAFDYMSGRFADQWVYPRVVLTSDAALRDNQQVVTEFISNLLFSADDGHRDRTTVQRHNISPDIPLQSAMEKLLVSMRITGTTDSQRNTGLLLQLKRALEDNPDEVCTIYRMSPAQMRQRGIDENGEITNLFQGKAPVYPREQRGEIYPGDQAICDRDNVTIQIHTLELTRDDQVISKNVPVVAVWVPQRMARSWIAQDEQ